MNSNPHPDNPNKHIDKVLESTSGSKNPAKAEQSSIITRSWQRCIDTYNISPENNFLPIRLTTSELKQHKEAFSDINNLAQNSVDKLFSMVSDIGYTVLLTDKHSVTVDCRYNKETETIFKDKGLYTGTDWSEDKAGTNGIGTCIVEKNPVTIERDDHFFPVMQSMTCTVSPIFDSHGQLLASLDATTLQPESVAQNRLICRLVEQYARQIESRSFVQEYHNEWLLFFSFNPEVSDPLTTGIFAINDEAQIVGCNRNAFVLLSNTPGKFIAHVPLESVFDLHFSDLVDESRRTLNSNNTIRSVATNREFFFKLKPPASKADPYGVSTHKKSRSTTNKSKLKSHPDLDQLVGEDIHLQVVRNKINQTINQDLNILIIGETGTGKEAFAKAIHDASDRKESPFIAINCAAIPDSLIESELFGYSSGTFTGALKKGMKGKVLQANNGTLFLDEIGDMPLHLQTRLLRVLSEMEVVPLGETQPIPLDIQLISATNKNVLNMIEDHSFRSDLYFRLNGVILELPSLRNRSDKQQLIAKLFHEHANGKEVSIDQDVIEILSQYNWPGNVRQLINVAKYANAMSVNGKISLNELPNDIRVAEVSPQTRSLNYSEYDLLFNSLKDNKWNITKVAKQLNICRATVYRKMRSYNIVPPNEQ